MTARLTSAAAVAAIVVACAVIGWRYHDAASPKLAANPHANNTAVLGSNGPPPPAAGLPRPPAPPRASVVTTQLSEREALALWVQDGQVYGARHTPESGWTDVHQLEQILGSAGDLQLAGNGRGSAMAVWRNSLGDIDSLRYSRFDAATGWSAPDVVPGVLPRHASASAQPRLAVDAEGDATLQWPSAFAGAPLQVSRFDPASGWSRPQDLAAR